MSVRRAFAITVGISVIVAGAIAPPTMAAAGELAACVKTKTGDVRMIKPTQRCNKGERRIAWSVVGPQGPAGPAGAPGAAGSPGATGAKGDTGATGAGGGSGPAGATGATGPAGSDGATGATGPAGPSNGYFATAGVSTITPGTPQIVVQTSTSVIEGDYLVTGVVALSDPSDSNNTVADCYLSMASTDSTHSYVTILEDPSAPAGGTLATLAVTYAYSSIPAGAHISLTCNATGGPINAVNASLTAVKVGSLN